MLAISHTLTATNLGDFMTQTVTVCMRMANLLCSLPIAIACTAVRSGFQQINKHETLAGQILGV